MWFGYWWLQSSAEVAASFGAVAVTVGGAGCVAQVAKALHHRFGPSACHAPFAHDGYFAEQVHRDFTR